MSVANPSPLDLKSARASTPPRTAAARSRRQAPVGQGGGVEQLWVTPAGVELPGGAGRALGLARCALRASCGAHRDAPSGRRRDAVDWLPHSAESLAAPPMAVARPQRKES